MSDSIKQFFQDFENASNNFNAVRSAEQFSDVFLHADPQGVRAVPKDAFIASLGKRKAFFDSLGLQSTELSVTEEIPLNASYTLAKVRVNMHFGTASEAKEVEQTANYIIKTDGPSPVIVFYMNDQLLSEVLAAHGLHAHPGTGS